MKAVDIHGMTDDELKTKLAELKDSLFDLRFRHAVNQLDDPMTLKMTKKDIARIKTEMRARELAKAEA